MMLLVCFVFFVLWIVFMVLYILERKPKLAARHHPINNRGQPVTLVNESNRSIDILKEEVPEQQLAVWYVQPSDVVLELGARYGSVSCVVNAKLADPTMHVAVEPDSTVWKALETNKEKNGAKFRIFKGTVGLKGTVMGVSQGYGTQFVEATDGGTTLSHSTVADFGLPFNVLIADCEGCLPGFFRDFPEMYDQLSTVMFEADAGADYSGVRQQLQTHGFTPMLQGFQNVWVS